MIYVIVAFSLGKMGGKQISLPLAAVGGHLVAKDDIDLITN